MMLVCPILMQDDFFFFLFILIKGRVPFIKLHLISLSFLPSLFKEGLLLPSSSCSFFDMPLLFSRLHKSGISGLL